MARRVLLCASLVVATLAPAIPAQAADRLDVDIKRAAQFISATEAQVRVRYVCPSGWTVLEAFLYITQDGNTSQFEGFSPTCDGRKHWATLTVDAFEETPFHRGTANATAYLLLEVPGGSDTASAGDTGVIHLR